MQYTGIFRLMCLLAIIVRTCTYYKCLNLGDTCNYKLFRNNTIGGCLRMKGARVYGESVEGVDTDSPYTLVVFHLHVHHPVHIIYMYISTCTPPCTYSYTHTAGHVPYM